MTSQHYYITGAVHSRKWHAGWIRVFGFGLSWTDHKYNRPYFSERNGYKKCLHVGSWCFGLLKP